MDQHDRLEIIEKAARKIVNCEDDFYSMKQAADNLYDVFKSITDIDIENRNVQDIMLSSGKAISPSAAAHCLLEMKRTAKFLRGIKKAIDHKITSKTGKIRVLYAGCGPYATLVTPLLTLYKTHQLQITLIDINEISLNAVEKLMSELGFKNFIDKYILADAAVYKMDTDYNIVISETMQSCLKNEPQVAIMQNLIPQMKDTAIFIPQQIAIDAYLCKPGKWNETKRLRDEDESKFLQRVFAVDKDHLDTNKFRAVVNIPDELNGYIELMLHTTITVFQDEVLETNNCSLNMPMKYYEFKTRYAKFIEFWYRFSPKPDIDCKVLELA